MKTRNQKTAKQATTTQNCFHAFAGDTKEHPMFSVNAGVPVDSALETASCLLYTVKQLLTSSADDGGMDCNQSAAVLILVTQAKAALDAAWEGIDDGEDLLLKAQAGE